MGMKFANNAWGALAAGITSGATSITLTAGHGARFPSLGTGDYFYAALINSANTIEFIKVTARSTDTLTVVRGIDGSTPTAYSAGDRIELRLIKSAMDNTLQLDAANNLTGRINEARGPIAMHATAMDLFAGPNILDGTGSAVTITAIANAPQAGARRTLYPVAGSTITNGATFAVDGGANQTAAAGDKWEFEAITISTYKVHITKFDGTAVVSPTMVGHTINTISTPKTDAFSTNSSSLVAITGLSVSATTSGAADKVAISSHVFVSCDTASANVFMQLFRDSTAIAQGSVGTGFTAGLRWPADIQITPYGWMPFPINFLDSPGAAGAYTYTLKISTNAGTVYVNVPANTGGLGNVSVVSAITAKVVKG